MIFLLSTAWATCSQPSNNAALARGIDLAMDAFEAMDDGTFAAARQGVLHELPCLNEPIKPEVAAAIHRIRGLSAFLEDDALTGQLYFAAARSIDPSYRFPESVAPQGNPLYEDYLALDASSDRTEIMPEPQVGYFIINGRQTRERSTNYPSLFQFVDGADQVIHTGLVNAGTVLPVDKSLLKQPQSISKTQAPQAHKKKINIPLFIGGAALGAVAGGLVLGNQLSFSEYNKHYEGLDANSSAEDLAKYDELRGTTNALGYAAVGAGIAAIGLGTTSLFVSGRF